MVVLTEVMPGSSSSSRTHDLDHYHPNHRYDVFLSFRGADTRNGFTDHLYNALLDAGINIFLDDEEIETGEPLKPELDSAIKSSRASIIVLSKNYASSTWCLDELVLILEQMKICKQIVIPIFYHVEPADVRKQQSSFGEAMANHKQKMELEEDAEKRGLLAQKMESWKSSLTEVADLKGRDVKNWKEVEFIREVIADIHRRLHVPLSVTLPLLIGMDYKIEFVSSWLTNGSCHTTDILTVVGMGGIGKTSLARHVFGLHFSKFDESSFIEGINTKANEHFDGLLNLQKQLHGDISKKIELRASDVFTYTFKIEEVLARKRVFIVLDDIGSLKQLDALLGKKGLYPGSKVIITTKDASLTKKGALFKSQAHPNHKQVLLNGLYKDQSLELLCIHAFNSQSPKEGYEEVSQKVVKYCDGHPLALKLLGTSLQNQDVEDWEDCIKVLKKEPHSHITTALRVSFDALPYEKDRELFKHIACFFVGMDRDLIETILNACGMNTRSGIPNLVDRCLLSVGSNNKLEMHSLIQEMGRDLVRQESPKKRSWCHEESMKVLKQKNGKGNLLGLTLDMRMLDKKKLRDLEPESLSEMDNLMLLQLNFVQLNECFQNFPEELRWLCMHGFPLKSIHLDVPMDNLVALDMSYSNIETFDTSAKRQKKMHFFSLLPALERLILRNCTRLIEVCESIAECNELFHIDLSYCCKLRKLPNSIGKLKKVKTLLLDGCNFGESQIETGNANAIIPSDSRFFKIHLPSSLRRLSLENNNLSNKCFPMDLSSLAMLEELCLDFNPIVSMPDCVRTLPRLQILDMSYCDKLISIENPPHTLRELSVYCRGRDIDNPSLRKIKFDPGMSPLSLRGVKPLLSSFEIDGMMKVQEMASFEEKVTNSLGWTNLNFIKERHLKIIEFYFGRKIECQTQLFYEFGIFSTFYDLKEMPQWIKYRSEGTSISFTIPSSSKRLRGLNLCCVLKQLFNEFRLPMIKISNITRNHTWIYRHCIEKVELSGNSFENVELNGNKNYYEDGWKYFLSWLSHWMFGPNEMKAGDYITIYVEQRSTFYDPPVGIECGIGLVYDGDGKSEEEEDVLGYYKSWNHIIGRDLSHFQLTSGEYILHYHQFSRFMRHSSHMYAEYTPFIGGRIQFKEKYMSFRAF